MLLPEEALEPPFTDDDLEAYFATEDEVTLEDFPGAERVAAWSVCDTGSAEYAMRRIAHAEVFIAEQRKDAAKFKAQIDAWLADQIKLPERAVNFFTGQLEAYARRKREEDGDKTVKLPSGQVTSRRNPARLDIPDATKDTFVQWALGRKLPIVKAKWSPVVDEVKKAVTFERVRVPDFHDGELRLQKWPCAEGEPVWVALPPTMSGPAGTTIAAEDLPFFHDEVWPICNGERVPGVVEVPAEVTYTVRPAL